MKPLHQTHRSGFTLLELLTVMAIIITLAGIILAGVGYAQQKAARERAVAEVAALGVALESYKADNGDYPIFDPASDDAGISATSTANEKGARLLFLQLKGKYYTFKNDMASNNDITTGSPFVIDPFGNAYGYSRKGQRNPTTMYDLWSTGGTTTTNDEIKWITNW